MVQTSNKLTNKEKILKRFPIQIKQNKTHFKQVTEWLSSEQDVKVGKK